MGCKLWIVAGGASMFALAGPSWPLDARSAPTICVGRALTYRSIMRLPLSPGHLFVLDHAQKAVYRFQLAQDGLPATKPDSVVFLVGAVYPLGLAVDKVGNIFVADPLGWGSAVAEFAAGATGYAQPISILLAYGPDRLRLDNAGRPFVHLNGNQDIAIYAKGSQGNDAPISVVAPIYQYEGATDFIIAKSGALYVDIHGGPGPVAVYNHPLNNPTSPDLLLMPQGGYEFFWGQTLALDAETNRLYIQFEVLNSKYWNKVNYGIRPASGTSIATDPMIFTGDCGSPGNSFVGSTLIVKKYLVVSCGSNGDVLVYRANQFGRQSGPVEIVGQGTLTSPTQMAVGP